MRIPLLSGTLAALLAVTLVGAAAAAEDEGVKAEQPELISLRFYAEWCGYCRVLDAKLDDVKQDFQDTPVWFTYVDITDEDTIRQSGFKAAQLGLGEIYEEYGNSTGDMVLVDASTGEVKDHITHEASEDELRDRISAALTEAAGLAPQ